MGSGWWQVIIYGQLLWMSLSVSFPGRWASFVSSSSWLWSFLGGEGGFFLGGGHRFHGWSALSQSNGTAYLLMCHIVGHVLTWLVTWLTTHCLGGWWWLQAVADGGGHGSYWQWW